MANQRDRDNEGLREGQEPENDTGSAVDSGVGAGAVGTSVGSVTDGGAGGVGATTTAGGNVPMDGLKKERGAASRDDEPSGAA